MPFPQTLALLPVGAQSALHRLFKAGTSCPDYLDCQFQPEVGSVSMSGRQPVALIAVLRLQVAARLSTVCSLGSLV